MHNWSVGCLSMRMKKVWKRFFLTVCNNNTEKIHHCILYEGWTVKWWKKWRFPASKGHLADAPDMNSDAYIYLLKALEFAFGYWLTNTCSVLLLLICVMWELQLVLTIEINLFPSACWISNRPPCHTIPYHIPNHTIYHIIISYHTICLLYQLYPDQHRNPAPCLTTDCLAAQCFDSPSIHHWFCSVHGTHMVVSDFPIQATLLGLSAWVSFNALER